MGSTLGGDIKSIGRKVGRGAKKAAKVAGKVNQMAADRIAKPALEALADPGGSARDLSRDVSGLIKNQIERKRFKKERAAMKTKGDSEGGKKFKPPRRKNTGLYGR